MKKIKVTLGIGLSEHISEEHFEYIEHLINRMIHDRTEYIEIDELEQEIEFSLAWDDMSIENFYNPDEDFQKGDVVKTGEEVQVELFFGCYITILQNTELKVMGVSDDRILVHIDGYNGSNCEVLLERAILTKVKEEV